MDSYLSVLYNTFMKDERYMLIVNGLMFTLSVTILAAIIGIILGVVGVLLAIIFYRKKALLGVSSLFTLASTIILACQGLTFLFVNPDLGEVVNQGSIEGLLETSCISIGGIIFAVCMGILFLMSLVRFFLTKSSSNK